MITSKQLFEFSVKVKLWNLALLLLSETRRRFFSREVHFGFYFDLCKEIKTDKTQFATKIQPIRPENIPTLLYSANNNLTVQEIRERLQRLLFLRKDIKTCFVALESDKKPCALCWLITPGENQKLQDYFNAGLPVLGPDEVLLEFIFVHPDYRGNGVMEWITRQLFLRAKSLGANRAIAYVRSQNTVSMAATKLIGWKPFIRKNVTWRLFKKQITYESL